jgi:uncharacterized protein (DUF983 family)
MSAAGAVQAAVGTPRPADYDAWCVSTFFRASSRLFRRFWILLGRSLRLRCPLCGRGRLFHHWLVMHRACPSCGTKFEREPGFFLGSIYINYGLTALIVSVAYPILLFNQVVAERPLLVGSLAFVAVFPVLIFPWARSLWLGFDQWHDPQDGELP